jgi:hypothetical protein
MLDPQTLPHDPKFRDMQNIIHMDEKWYDTTSRYDKYYMLPGEDDPHRTVQNKNSIGKIMFLTAVGRPFYDAEGNCIFDGKIGMWPLVRKVQNKLVQLLSFFFLVLDIYSYFVCLTLGTSKKKKPE